MVDGVADAVAMPVTLPYTAPRPVEVFAVDDRSVQIVWRPLGRGAVVARIGDRLVEMGDGTCTGAAEIGGLLPTSHYEVVVSLGDRIAARLDVNTAPSLGQGPVTKVATISDVHLGETGFGLVKRINEPRDVSCGYPLRCAAAAVDEARQWGAELLVVKGDITDESRPEEWEQFDELLAGAGMPVVAIPGNHDTIGRHHSLDGRAELERRGLFSDPIQVVDLPWARLLVVDSTVAGRSHGRIAPHRSRLLELVDVDRPVVVFTHHHLEATPIPWFWPLGSQARDGYGTLDALLDVNPDIFVSSGHTHRNRARRHRTAVVTEVGSPKDHPGGWGGYEIGRRGVRQTVRRVSRPDCISWTERTRVVVGGIWGRWSPGDLASRCLTHDWVNPADRTVSSDAIHALSARGPLLH